MSPSFGSHIRISFPNAKINLGLDIVRRRPDGYHDISTVMIPVPWCDILEAVPAKDTGTTLTVTGRTVDCPPEKNLVMKAFRALERLVELPPLDLYLSKVIPDGAGLGGGSSDASTLLKMLDSMLGLDLGSEQLAEVASTLGADCPFFIADSPMLCTGTGTVMTPIDIPALEDKAILIVKPRVSVPTAAAYSKVVPSVPSRPVEEILSLPIQQWQGLLKNDFEPSVFEAYPEVARVKESIMSLAPLYASMSGSGSAVYGLFDNATLAERAAESFGAFDHLVAAMD